MQPLRSAALLLLLALGTAARAQDNPAPASLIPAISVAPSDDETSFYASLESEIDRIYAVHTASLPDRERISWESVKHAVVTRLKGMAEIRHVVRRYGLPVGATIISAEIAKYAGFALLMHMGYPALAGIYYFTPFIYASTLASIYAVRRYENNKAARAVGLKSTRELEKFEKEFLGYDLDQRILSAVVETTEGEMKKSFALDIVEKYKERAKEHSAAVIGADELEKLVKSKGKDGKAYLKAVGEQRPTAELRAALMLRFISAHPELLQQLTKNAEERAALKGGAEGGDEVRAELVRLHRLERESQRIGHELREKGQKAEREAAEALTADLRRARYLALYREASARGRAVPEIDPAAHISDLSSDALAARLRQIDSSNEALGAKGCASSLGALATEG